MIAVPRRMAVLRVLLLLATALGVAGMHTMGHPSGGHAAFTQVSEMGSGMRVHAAAVPVDGSARPQVTLPHPGGGLDPSEVCLAVLTLVGLAVLVAAGLLAARRLAAAALVPAGAAMPGRGPPPRWPPLGLLLADLSVLRR